MSLGTLSKELGNMSGTPLDIFTTTLRMPVCASFTINKLQIEN